MPSQAARVKPILALACAVGLSMSYSYKSIGHNSSPAAAAAPQVSKVTQVAGDTATKQPASAGPCEVGSWSLTGTQPCEVWTTCPEGTLSRFKPTQQNDRECVPTDDPCTACAAIAWDQVDEGQFMEHQTPASCSFIDLGQRVCVPQDCEAEGDHEFTKDDDRTHKFAGVECSAPRFILERHVSKFITSMGGRGRAGGAAVLGSPPPSLPHHSLTKTAAALHDKRHHSCSEYGTLLDGVDIYVIEMPQRKGKVEEQMKQYGVPCCVHAIDAVTPQTELDEYGTTATVLANECAIKPRGGLPYGPFHVHDTAFSNTLSHLKALKHACEQENHADVLVVLEDDAQFEPMHFWPGALSEMLKELPPSWQIVNGACSNKVSGYADKMFRAQTLGRDYGTIAIVYNLAAPAVCARVTGKTPLEFMRAAAETCQPADIILYSEFAGPEPVHTPGRQEPYTAERPLFYFSSKNPNEEENFVKDPTHLTDAYARSLKNWAENQRKGWARFWASRDKQELVGGESCRNMAAEAAASEAVLHASEAIAVTSQDQLRDDERCGMLYKAPNGKPAACGKSNNLCCGELGWCGRTEEHCDCEFCQRYTIQPGVIAER